MLTVVILYALAVIFVPSNSSSRVMLALHFTHALTWCLFHYVGLGLLLRAQSKSKFLVRHYIKNYHYPEDSRGAIMEAFSNWKVIYNMSICMTHGTTHYSLGVIPFLIASSATVSCMVVVAKTYLIPNDWSVGSDLLCHTLGAVSLHTVHAPCALN